MNKQEDQTASFLYTVGAACVIIGFIGSCLIGLWALGVFMAVLFGMICIMTALLSVAGAFDTPQKNKQLRINERYTYTYSKQKGKNKKFKNGGMKF